MAIKFLGVGDEINAIIRKHSEAALVRYLPRLKSELAFIGISWNQLIRKRLSVIVPKPWDSSTPRNLTPWPKRRTGKLYFSILIPKVMVKNRTPKFKGRRGRTTVEFVLSNFYGSIARTGYGETLNSRRDFDDSGGSLGVKPFAGWKTRASRILFDLISQRL